MAAPGELPNTDRDGTAMHDQLIHTKHSASIPCHVAKGI
jgi:hypothetical protein